MRYQIIHTCCALAALGASTLPSAFAAEITGVPDPNPKLPGISAPNLISPELRLSPVAEGSMRLYNSEPGFEFYGFASDGPHVPAPGAIPSSSGPIEATKTEPDKNTYLVLHGSHGADPSYNYGTHFLFQGHENAAEGKEATSPVSISTRTAHTG